MESGRLFLSDSSAATCSYEFATSTDGFLHLGAAFIAMGEGADATLELATGERRRVAVTFGSRVGQASFVCP
jgi:hypothetical protein